MSLLIKFDSIRVVRALKTLDTKISRKITRSSLRPALKPMMEDIKKSTPVRTGRLRKQLKLVAMKRSRKYIGLTITFGSPSGTRGKDGKIKKKKVASAYQGKGFYGAFLEVGTKHIKARHIMRDRIRANQSNSFRIFNREAWRLIRQEWANA